MLDVKFVRDNLERVEQALQNRGSVVELDEFMELEKKRRELINEVDGLKNKRNSVTGDIRKLKAAGQNAAAMIAEMRGAGDKIAVLDGKIKTVEAALHQIMLSIPNLPDKSVPIGKAARDNQEIRRWGTPRQFDHAPLPHWELGEKLGILDFERGGKVTGARFTFSKGLGAQLERALINFMLNLHTEQHGYTEILPPFVVNEASMTGTGQLPKFAEDMFKLEGLDYYLIPTSEVPLCSIHRQELLDANALPLYYTAYSPCFRAEAGAAGRDTRGLIRQHQFNKVELVKFSLPEESYNELEKMTHDAEHVLQLLGLPYRTMLLCTGDMGFASAKTYDLEVWLPSFNTYREISSCSNITDFQARRADIRFRRTPNGKPEFVHTLNGSGLAVGRTVAAILENYQQNDGTVAVPAVLRPYLGVASIK